MLRFAYRCSIISLYVISWCFCAKVVRYFSYWSLLGSMGASGLSGYYDRSRVLFCFQLM